MNTKLTLKLKKKSIERAKRYAQKNKKSLSIMVERYFDLVSLKDNDDDFEISPNIIELSGIVKWSANMDIKKDYEKHLEEKYLK